MPRYAVLLRGINVGGKRMLPMALLRETLEAAGARDVTTYIQSGNAVLTHAATPGKLVATLEKVIEKAAGFPVPVVVRTKAELDQVIEDNPFTGADPDHLHVMFLQAKPGAFTLDAKPFLPERYAIVGRDVYLCLPTGLGRSKLVGTLARQKPLASATVRNWRTVQKLAELLQ